MKIRNCRAFAALKTDLFNDFLKCVEIASSGNTIQALFFYDVATKLVMHYSERYVKSFDDDFEQGSEVIMSKSPADVALSFTHWLLGIETRPKWIPKEFEKNKKNVEPQIQKTMNMYRAFENQSSNIIIPGQ